MTNESPSRDPVPATLAGVLDLIGARSDLKDWLRRDLSWGIRTFCHALGQSPSDVLADPLFCLAG
jgi:hypothetical protein